jgi:hypothetical protein
MRLVGIDFGPRNMAFCLVDTMWAPTHQIRAILDWTLMDITRMLRQTASTQPTQLPAKWETRTVAELRSLAVGLGWVLDADVQAWSKTRLVAWLRPKQRAARVAASSTKPCSFYQGYVRMAAHIGDYLDDLHQRYSFDHVVCEHQPATTRYENIVLESLVVGHVAARGWGVTTLHPGLKYKGFEDLRPPTAQTLPGGRRLRRALYAALRHDANKTCSVRACERLLAPAGPQTGWSAMQGKKDDLADALLVAWAFSRMTGVPPSDCPPSRSEAPTPEEQARED